MAGTPHLKAVTGASEDFAADGADIRGPRDPPDLAAKTSGFRGGGRAPE
jgi:hypothetical protein